MRRSVLSLIFAVVICLTASSAFAEASQPVVEIENIVMEIGENSVAYPQLKGLNDEDVMTTINSDIILSGRVSSHIVTLSTVANSPWGLKVTYQHSIGKNYFSVLIRADGKQPEGGNGSSLTALTYDLSTGKRITMDQLFASPEEAVETMEQIAEETIGTEMTEYMEHTDIRPLPVDNFFMDQTGITFCYPQDQLLYLSGNPVACHFFYDELDGFLLTDEAALPAKMGILPKAFSPDDARKIIEESVAAGCLPGVNTFLGRPMPELVDVAQLLREPDTFPGGRYYLLEAPEFRNVYLISDDMQPGYEHSVLTGIQQRRGSFGGLVIGKTTREEWLQLLGLPQETIQFTENMSYDYQLPVGLSDKYFFGDHELRLHSNENGVLFAIQLNQ